MWLRVWSDIFLFKESKSEKKYFFFEGSEGKGGFASLSEFVFQRIFKLKKRKNFFSFSFFF